MRLSKIVQAVRAGLMWSKAKDQLVAGRHDDAMRTMRQFYAVIRADLPSLKAPLLANLLSAQIAYRIHDPQLVSETGEMTLAQINAEAGKLSSNDIGYVEHYLEQLFDFCAGRFIEKQDYFLLMATQANRSRSYYELNLVRPDIVRMFPLLSFDEQFTLLQ